MTHSSTPPDSETRSSFYHLAATVSLFGVPLAVAMNLLAGMSPNLESRLSGGRMAAIFGGICIVVGLVAGVVAFFGIPKYGRKGLLWKALVGTLLPLGLFALAVPTFLVAVAKSRELAAHPPTVEEQLTKIVDRLNGRKGEMIDANTQLAGAEAGPGRTLVYRYTVLKVSRENFDAGLPRIRENFQKAYESSAEIRAFRENGVTMISRYANEAGEAWGEIKVGPAN